MALLDRRGASCCWRGRSSCLDFADSEHLVKESEGEEEDEEDGEGEEEEEDGLAEVAPTRRGDGHSGVGQQ